MVQVLSHQSLFNCIHNNISSPDHSITHGVYQGSVLGLTLFNIYLLPLLNILNSFTDIPYDVYADNIQLYTNYTVDSSYAPNILSLCFTIIHLWLNQNYLCLNPSKFEAILLPLPPDPTVPSSTYQHICLYSYILL